MDDELNGYLQDALDSWNQAVLSPAYQPSVAESLARLGSWATWSGDSSGAPTPDDYTTTPGQQPHDSQFEWQPRAYQAPDWPVRSTTWAPADQPQPDTWQPSVVDNPVGRQTPDWGYDRNDPYSNAGLGWSTYLRDTFAPNRAAPALDQQSLADLNSGWDTYPQQQRDTEAAWRRYGDLNADTADSYGHAANRRYGRDAFVGNLAQAGMLGPGDQGASQPTFDPSNEGDVAQAASDQAMAGLRGGLPGFGGAADWLGGKVRGGLDWLGGHVWNGNENPGFDVQMMSSDDEIAAGVPAEPQTLHVDMQGWGIQPFFSWLGENAADPVHGAAYAAHPYPGAEEMGRDLPEDPIARWQELGRRWREREFVESYPEAVRPLVQAAALGLDLVNPAYDVGLPFRAAGLLRTGERAMEAEVKAARAAEEAGQVGAEGGFRAANSVLDSTRGEEALSPTIARLTDAEHSGGDVGPAAERPHLESDDAGLPGGTGRRGEAGGSVAGGSGPGVGGDERFPFRRQVQQLLEEGRLREPVTVDDLRTPTGLRSSSLFVTQDGAMYAVPSTHADAAMALLGEAGAPPEAIANIHRARASAHTQAGLLRVATSRNEVAVSAAGPVTDAQVRAISRLAAKNRGGSFRFDIEDAAGTPIKVGEGLDEFRSELGERRWRIWEPVEWNDETFGKLAARPSPAPRHPSLVRPVVRDAVEGGAGAALKDAESDQVPEPGDVGRRVLAGALLGGLRRMGLQGAPYGLRRRAGLLGVPAADDSQPSTGSDAEEREPAQGSTQELRTPHPGSSHWAGSSAPGWFWLPAPSDGGLREARVRVPLPGSRGPHVWRPAEPPGRA